MGPEYHSCLDKPSDDGLGKASAERLTTGTASVHNTFYCWKLTLPSNMTGNYYICRTLSTKWNVCMQDNGMYEYMWRTTVNGKIECRRWEGASCGTV